MSELDKEEDLSNLKSHWLTETSLFEKCAEIALVLGACFLLFWRVKLVFDNHSFMSDIFWQHLVFQAFIGLVFINLYTLIWWTGIMCFRVCYEIRSLRLSPNFRLIWICSNLITAALMALALGMAIF